MVRPLLLLCCFLSAAACGGSQSGVEASPSASAEPAPTAAPPEPDEDDPAPRPLESKGEVAGSVYRPVVALASGSFQRQGHLHVLLELFEEPRDCASKPKAKKGDRQLMMSVPWEQGAKLDLSLPPPDMAFNPNKMKVWQGSRWDEASGWSGPFGTVTVLEAPSKSGEKGRIRLKVRAGQVRIRGDVPVLLCVDAR